MSMRPEAYTVGWICAIPVEYVAACELLDEEYCDGNVPKIHARGDRNLYTFGRIHEHKVVIACLPDGRYGTTSATLVAERMRLSFPALRFSLMVGIAGGAPSLKHDVRLGDVVVSIPTPGYGGIIQYDLGKAVEHHVFEQSGHLAPPPEILLNAVSLLRTKHKRKGHSIVKRAADLVAKNERLRNEYSRPHADSDRLYQISSTGIDELVHRNERNQDDAVVIHYGLIASANQLMKDREARNALIAKYDVLCFETEAAGLMNNFPFIVIRGICDYSDPYKNDEWQGYAAATATAFAKELLEVVPTVETGDMQAVDAAIEQDPSRFNIAFSLNGVPIAKTFIDRPVEMKKIEDVLIMPVVKQRQIYVLRGLGGIGKTQLAVSYMRKHKDHYSSIFWLDGSSSDSLTRSLAGHLIRLPQGQISKGAWQSLQNGPTDIDQAAREVLNWLGIQANNNWLLVFDNVDRKYTTEDPLSYSIRQYLPDADHGSILITTRLTQPEQIGMSQQIKRVDKNTAISILNSWIDNTRYDGGEVALLLQKLHGLPLAIAQAGAFLASSGMSIKTYLKLYEEQWHELAQSLQGPEAAPLQDYHNRSIWTTWSISYEAIRASNPHAAHLLLIWSYINNKDLWFGIFAGAVSSSLSPQLYQKWLGEIVCKETAFHQALEMLSSYSLIESLKNTNGYATHALVHKWAYSAYGRYYQEEFTILTTRLLGCAISRESAAEYSTFSQRLLPHAQAWYERIAHVKTLCFDTGSQLEEKLFLDAVHKLARLFLDQGKWSEAEVVFMLALEGYENLLGEMHECTLGTVNDLSAVYQRHGRLDKAEQMQMRALKLREEQFGRNHISMILTASSLGVIYHAQGRDAEAEEMFLRASQGFEEEYGMNHRSSLKNTVNFGLLRISQGRFDDAEKAFTQALEGYGQILGAEHPDTIWTISCIGYLHAEQDKLDEAEIMYTQALEGFERVYSPNHPSVLETLDSLGSLYTKQGKLDHAEKMLDRALEGRNTTVRETDSMSSNIIAHLGNVYRKQRRFEEAEKAYSQVLEYEHTALGPDHPDTLTHLRILALLYAEQGKLVESEKLHEQILISRKKVLGLEHHNTLNTMIDLGKIYADQGMLEEAESIYTQALKTYERKLGAELPKDDVSVVALLVNLGNLYAYTQPEKSRDMYQRALPAITNIYGLSADLFLSVTRRLRLYEVAEQQDG